MCEYAGPRRAGTEAAPTKMRAACRVAARSATALRVYSRTLDCYTYAGMTWGGNQPWVVRHGTWYGQYHSPTAFVWNNAGYNNLWFAWPGEVGFLVAWFSKTIVADTAAQIRFHDDRGRFSDWVALDPAGGSTWVQANFRGAKKVYVDHGGADAWGKWYAMDDVTYSTPEPATLALLGAGLALGGIRRRRARC